MTHTTLTDTERLTLRNTLLADDDLGLTAAQVTHASWLLKPHVEAIVAARLAERDHTLTAAKADAWDEGLATGMALVERGFASPNPYRVVLDGQAPTPVVDLSPGAFIEVVDLERAPEDPTEPARDLERDGQAPTQATEEEAQTLPPMLADRGQCVACGSSMQECAFGTARVCCRSCEHPPVPVPARDTDEETHQ